jgi:hypothetical protein
MSRAAQRSYKKAFQKDIVEFLKVQNHFFPSLIKDLSQVQDPRNQSYIEYDIEEILYTMLMKNICSISSMQDMTDKFNEEECVQNICKILGKDEKEFMPHYVTINECLEKLPPNELDKFRKKLIYKLLRKRSFENARFLGKYWLVIVDATQLFYFKEKHCDHCLKKATKKGTPEEKTYYYHNVLEAKIVLGENLVISIATEFIENEKEDVSKQDCESNAFKRLSAKLKKLYPRLPICILGDSLYACEPTLAEDFHDIIKMGECSEKIKIEENIYKRKERENVKNRMKWVSELYYQGHLITVMELKIEKEQKEAGEFQWVTNLKITGKTAWEFAKTGRKRWQIENEGFNIQKNHRYDITHANS